jgi:VWFA-related protein
MRTIVAVACVLLLAVPVSPQSPQPRRSAESIDVVLVEVPVTVVDRDGNPIRNLTKENFEVWDGREKRDITYFDVLDLAKLAGETADLKTPVQVARSFMLLFDTTHAAPASLMRAREAAGNFVDKQLLPRDRVAVGMMSVQNGFVLLTGFTTDRELVRRAVDTLGEPSQFQIRDPLLLAANDFDARANETLGDRGGPEGAAAARTAAIETFRDMARDQRRTARDQQKQEILRQFDDLSSLARVLDRVHGRKQVILLSEGFDAKAVQGRESLSTLEAREEQIAIERGAVWNVDNENRYGSVEANNALRRMIDALRRSDVIMHAIDIKGLRTDVDASGHNPSSTESLSLLTRDTGGTVFKHSNDLAANFERMLRQQDVTYLLAFQTRQTTPGKFHDLKVKVSGIPAGARVSNRSGYFEDTAITSEIDRTLSAGEILMNSVPVDDVKVRVFTAAYPRRSNAAQAPVVLEIDGKSLVAGSIDRNVPTDFYVYAFDDQDQIRDFAYQRVTLDMAKLRTKIEAKGVKFYSTLLLPPGDFSLRVLVRTAAGRSGFTTTRVHVPAEGEALAVPVMFDESPGWVMIKAQDRPSAPAYPFIAGTTSFVPAARAVIATGAPYTMAVMTYNLAPEQVRVEATVNGQPVPLSFLGKTNPDADGGVKLMYELRPPRLASGEYQLMMNLRTAADAAPRSIALPVEVR